MDHDNEKQAFSRRLKEAIKSSSKNPNTPSKLALEFNLLYKAGKEPVSPQACQKWLTAQAIPTKDKLETLAKLLNVSPTWLRYGYAEGLAASSEDGLTDQEFLLLSGFRELSEDQQQLVTQLIEQLRLGARE